MKTIRELRDILEKHKRTDSHVHTHLCDGKSEMTVENIASEAEKKGLDCIILTPHFHKKVSDASDTLYEDSNEDIFLALREEIEAYKKRNSAVEFLLSAEADILSCDGDISLKISNKAENALDMVHPTFNYHPLLPLKFVHLTYGKDVNALHQSGEYASAAKELGGIGAVLEGMYTTEENAIKNCQYPSMLGHLFMTHSIHPDMYSCFDAREEHLPIMKEGVLRIIEACRERHAMIDLTGVHLQKCESADDKIAKNAFLVEFQTFVIRECIKRGVFFCFGSDAHSLNGVGSAREYYNRLLDMI